jgi:methyl-accepting chemotaxis protein
MGALAGFYRESIGNLWKISAQLAKQLSQLLASVQELFVEFQAEVEYLSRIGENLEIVRREMLDIAKRVSDLRVNASNDSAFMKQMDETTDRALSEIKGHGEVVNRISEDIRGIDGLAANMKSVMGDFLNICAQVSEIGKSVSDLSTETGLVKLNASIDAVQGQGGKEGNYRKLVEEMQLLADKINDIKQVSVNVAGLAESKIQDLGKRLKSGGDKLVEGLADADKTRSLFERMGQDYMAVAASFDSIFDNVKRLNQLMSDVDGKTVSFAGSIKGAAEGFDKLKADTQITLIRFGQLSGKMEGVRESLKKLEEFKNLFQIA